ncbi:hypothetical protein A2U01_0044139, partial [Trifolium medium]|nr:hypothetical protein [Trifolium medium]
MADFKNLEANGFNIRTQAVFHGWETYFDRLKGPVYPCLVKDFWKQAKVITKEIKSHVM